jgi:hypothetical protein
MDKLEKAQLEAFLARVYKDKEKDFFKGLPPELRKNYAVYQQRRQALAKVGVPLAPGGVFMLGNEAVVSGAMAELHTALARLLALPVDHITLRLEPGLRVEADVTMPKDYTLPLEIVGQNPVTTQAEVQTIYRQYMESTMQLLNEQFKRDLAARLDANETRRPDLEQPLNIEGWDGKEESKEEAADGSGPN